MCILNRSNTWTATVTLSPESSLHIITSSPTAANGGGASVSSSKVRNITLLDKTGIQTPAGRVAIHQVANAPYHCGVASK